MALAATEKAKVWTSVRMRYLKVESTRPGDRREAGRGVRGEPVAAWGSVGIGGLGTGMAQSYQSGAPRPGAGKPHFGGGYRDIPLSALKLFNMTGGHIAIAY